MADAVPVAGRATHMRASNEPPDGRRTATGLSIPFRAGAATSIDMPRINPFRAGAATSIDMPRIRWYIRPAPCELE